MTPKCCYLAALMTLSVGCGLFHGTSALKPGLVMGPAYPSYGRNLGSCLFSAVNLVLGNNGYTLTGAPVSVSLATSSASGTFYTDAGCTKSSGAVTVATGQSAAPFWYKDQNPGLATLSATDPSGVYGVASEQMSLCDQITYRCLGR